MIKKRSKNESPEFVPAALGYLRHERKNEGRRIKKRHLKDERYLNYLSQEDNKIKQKKSSVSLSHTHS